MDTLLSMRIFCTVAELRSFTAAADTFNIAHSAVSKHVAMLERRLSARLLNRTSRRVSLTEVGALYLEQARRILESVDEAEAAARTTSVRPSGLLRISAPPWLVNEEFVALLADYRRAYPDVMLDIDIDLIERGLSHDAGNLDIALRITNTPGDGMIAQLLVQLTFRIVATPAYLDAHGRPRTPQDVDGWPLLHYSVYPTDGTIVFRTGERVRFRPVMQSSSTALIHLATKAGIAPAFMPAALIEKDVAEGRLEYVLPVETANPISLYAIYPRRPYVSAKVKSFLDFLQAAYR